MRNDKIIITAIIAMVIIMIFTSCTNTIVKQGEYVPETDDIFVEVELDRTETSIPSLKTSSESQLIGWEERQTIGREMVAAYKQMLKEHLKSDKFVSEEAREFISKLANAPLEAERDNFYLSEEEWSYILSFEKKYINHSSEREMISISNNLVYIVDGSSTCIEIINPDNIKYWNICWD